jgi:tetratricopeptide (TPR) repeat protein
MNELDIVNAKFKNMKRTLLVIMIPFVLFTLLFGAKVATMNYLAISSSKDYAHKHYSVAQQKSEKSKIINVLEGWKAYYNSGTDLIQLGTYDLAVTDLKKSLSLIPDPKKQCAVRANLAIAYEGQGDNFITEKRFDDAQKSLDLSKKTLSDSDKSCKNPEKNPVTSDSMSKTKDRLDKSGGSQNDSPKPTKQQPSQEQIDAVQEQVDKNNEKRQEGTAPKAGNTNEGQQSSGTNPDGPDQSVDKPW